MNAKNISCDHPTNKQDNWTHPKFVISDNHQHHNAGVQIDTPKTKSANHINATYHHAALHWSKGQSVSTAGVSLLLFLFLIALIRRRVKMGHEKRNKKRLVSINRLIMAENEHENENQIHHPLMPLSLASSVCGSTALVATAVPPPSSLSVNQPSGLVISTQLAHMPMSLLAHNDATNDVEECGARGDMNQVGGHNEDPVVLLSQAITQTNSYPLDDSNKQAITQTNSYPFDDSNNSVSATREYTSVAVHTLPTLTSQCNDVEDDDDDDFVGNNNDNHDVDSTPLSSRVSSSNNLQIQPSPSRITKPTSLVSYISQYIGYWLTPVFSVWKGRQENDGDASCEAPLNSNSNIIEDESNNVTVDDADRQPHPGTLLLTSYENPSNDRNTSHAQLFTDREAVTPDDRQIFIDREAVSHDDRQLSPDDRQLFIDREAVSHDDYQLLIDIEAVTPDDRQIFIDREAVSPDDREVFIDREAAPPDDRQPKVVDNGNCALEETNQNGHQSSCDTPQTTNNECTSASTSSSQIGRKEGTSATTHIVNTPAITRNNHHYSHGRHHRHHQHHHHPHHPHHHQHSSEHHSSSSRSSSSWINTVAAARIRQSQRRTDTSQVFHDSVAPSSDFQRSPSHLNSSGAMSQTPHPSIFSLEQSTRSHSNSNYDQYSLRSNTAHYQSSHLRRLHSTSRDTPDDPNHSPSTTSQRSTGRHGHYVHPSMTSFPIPPPLSEPLSMQPIETPMAAGIFMQQMPDGSRLILLPPPQLPEYSERAGASPPPPPYQ